MTIRAPKGTEFRVFECADCPDDETRYRYIAPIRIGAHYDASGPIDHCPTCESYLSMCGGWSGVLVETKPTEAKV
jgi:hypothetical protein